MRLKMYPLLTNINSQFIDSCGKPLSGGKVYTYEANTTTPKLTYADTNGQSPNTHPIILDESGRANIYMADGAYRIRVLDKKDALVADTPKISRYVTNTELETFIQNIEAGLSELEQVKESLDIFVNAAIAEQKGAASGLAPLDANTKVDPLYLPTATETTIGAAEIATQAEANAATDDARFVTPLKLLNGVKNHLNVSGDAPMYACRAWVNFDGDGVLAIKGSGNVSSVTDNGIGDYTINFTTAMPDANYSFTSSAIEYSTVAPAYIALRMTVVAPTLKSVNGFRVIAKTPSATNAVDLNNISIQVAR